MELPIYLQHQIPPFNPHVLHLYDDETVDLEKVSPPFVPAILVGHSNSRVLFQDRVRSIFTVCDAETKKPMKEVAFNEFPGVFVPGFVVKDDGKFRIAILAKRGVELSACVYKEESDAWGEWILKESKEGSTQEMILDESQLSRSVIHDDGFSTIYWVCTTFAQGQSSQSSLLGLRFRESKDELDVVESPPGMLTLGHGLWNELSVSIINETWVQQVRSMRETWVPSAEIRLDGPLSETMSLMPIASYFSRVSQKPQFVFLRNGSDIVRVQMDSDSLGFEKLHGSEFLITTTTLQERRYTYSNAKIMKPDLGDGFRRYRRLTPHLLSFPLGRVI